MFLVHKNGDKKNVVRNNQFVFSFKVVWKKPVEELHHNRSAWFYAGQISDSISPTLISLLWRTELKSMLSTPIYLKAVFDKLNHNILLPKLSRLGAIAKLTSSLGSRITGSQLREKIVFFVRFLQFIQRATRKQPEARYCLPLGSWVSIAKLSIQTSLKFI